MSKRKTPTDWWDRYLEPTHFETTEYSSIDVKKLIYAMFERAWYDLAISPDIKPEHRRSAIAWFRGVYSEKILFSYEMCEAVVGMTRERKQKLRERIKVADSYKYVDKAAVC